MIYLKQSTASQEIPLGFFVDSTDGNTEETGLSIANTDIKLWKNGATTLANKNSGGATHISNGIYYAVLDATDTDTLGPLVIFVHVSGALTVRLECCVLTANVYDSLIAGSDLLDINVSQYGGTNGTFASGRPEVKLGDVAHGGSAAVLTFERLVGVSTTSNQPAISLTGNGSAPAVRRTGGSTAAGEESTAGAFANTGGAIFTGKGSGPGLGLLAGPTGHGLWALGGSTSGDGVRAENVGTGYDINASLQGSVSGTVGGIAGTLQTIDALWAKIKKYFQLLFRKDAAIATDNATELTEINADGGSGAGAFANSTDSVEAIRDNMSTPPTASAVADAVWDEARSGHTTSGTFGEGVKAESLNSQAQSDVEAIVDGIIQSYFDPSSNGNYADLQHLVSAATIATLTSQTQFTLSFGSPDNDAYNGALIVVSDAVTANQRCFGYISDYVGSTKAVTLRADPGIFTMAVGDRVDIYAKPTVDVESMVDNVITAAKIASDAITAAKIAADAIGASEIAAGALDADAFTTALAQKIADVILRRQMDNVEASSNGDTLDKSSLYGLVQQAQEANTVDNAGELTIYKTDGTTELGRLTLDTDAAAEPVTGVS